MNYVKKGFLSKRFSKNRLLGLEFLKFRLSCSPSHSSNKLEFINRKYRDIRWLNRLKGGLKK